MKGVGFVNVRSYVETLHGSRQWQRILNRFKPNERTIIESASAVGWYRVMLFADLLRAIDAECGKGDFSTLRAIGAFEADRDFNRIVRVFLRVFSPMQLFKVEGRIWRQFHDAGEWHSVPAKRCKGMDATLTGWAVDEALCIELAGYLTRLLEYTGGRNASVEHDQCRARGDECCIFRYRWD